MDADKYLLEDDQEPEEGDEGLQPSWPLETSEEDDWAIRNNIERRSAMDRRFGEDRRGDDRRGVGSSVDPMNIYLREMGNQRLLSHEEEMELARMVEDGETRIQQAILRLTLGVTALNDLAENLLRGNVRINSVIRGLSDNDEQELTTVRDAFLEQVEKANELDAQRRELFFELRKNAGNGDKEAQLVGDILTVGGAIADFVSGVPALLQGSALSRRRGQGIGTEIQ